MTPAPATFPERVLEDVQRTDLAVYRAIATSPTPTLDRALRRLSKTADHSVLWLGIAGALAVRPGRPRRAAFYGLESILVASATVNILGKGLARRARPDPLAAAVPARRSLRMPGSTSFPSGHAASALAFATALGHELPWLSLPVRLLAVTVAYSRVHVGVHYPADVVVGAAIGATCAEATGYARQRIASRRT